MILIAGQHLRLTSHSWSAQLSQILLGTSGMRILHVTESLGQGGKERQIAELLSGLLPHRDIKSFVAVMSEEDFRYEIDSERVQIIPVVRKSRRDCRPFKRLYELASN